MAAPYVPIDCGIHDELELHAMRRNVLDVDFLDPGPVNSGCSDVDDVDIDAGAGRIVRLEAVRLVTTRSQAGVELGVFRDENGRETVVRLDRLRVVEDRRTSRRLEMPDVPARG